jgi:hypothetical protein
MGGEISQENELPHVYQCQIHSLHIPDRKSIEYNILFNRI